MFNPIYWTCEICSKDNPFFIEKCNCSSKEIEMARNDLVDHQPIVYNGRSVEEWYSMFCHEAATHNTTKYHLAQAKQEIESLRARLKGDRSVRDIQGDDCVSVW